MLKRVFWKSAIALSDRNRLINQMALGQKKTHDKQPIEQRESYCRIKGCKTTYKTA